MRGLSAAAGMHRFTWDVHLQPLAGGGGGGRGGGGGLPMQAIPFDTAPAPGTPWANPGTSAVKLTVNGKVYAQPITVKQDPRVKTPALAMQQIYTLTKSILQRRGGCSGGGAARVQNVRDQIALLVPKATGAVAQALTDFDKKVETLGAAPVAAAPGGGAPATAAAGGGAGARGGGAGRGGRGGGAPGAPPNAFTSAGSALSGLMNSLQAADVRRRPRTSPERRSATRCRRIVR